MPPDRTRPSSKQARVDGMNGTPPVLSDCLAISERPDGSKEAPIDFRHTRCYKQSRDFAAKKGFPPLLPPRRSRLGVFAPLGWGPGLQAPRPCYACSTRALQVSAKYGHALAARGKSLRFGLTPAWRRPESFASITGHSPSIRLGRLPPRLGLVLPFPSLLSLWLGNVGPGL